MALGTVTEVKKGVVGDLKYSLLDVNVTSGANYTTGGEAFGVSNVPDFRVEVLAVVPQSTAGGHLVLYDAVNKKLMAFVTGAALSGVLAQAASGADLSAAGNKVRVFVLGK